MMNKSEKNRCIGFSGFNEMISDISDDIENVSMSSESISTEPSKTTTKENESPNRAQSTATKIKPVKTKGEYKEDSNAKLGRALIIIVVLISVVVAVANNKSDYNKSHNISNKPPSSNYNKQQPAIKSPTRPTESKPSYGSRKVLGRSQIRYCLAQGIRIDGVKEKLNRYSKAEINKSNAMVDDFNKRCGEYRYRSGDQNSSQRDINKHRSSYKKEGYAILQSWRGISPNKKKTVKIDQTVLSIQKRLISMGYKPGVADGIMGKKTREAIKSYQRGNFLNTDGKPTWSLLVHMNKKTNK